MTEPPAPRVPEVLRRARRLGVFGGSFDPVHRGHLHAARAAQRACDLDHVVFVPAARSPHKAEPARATGAERLRMLELALADEPSWSAWDVELERGAPSYTLETVRLLDAGRGGGGLFLVLGADNLDGLATWRGVQELFERVEPVVVRRRPGAVAATEELRAALGPELAERLAAGYVDAPPFDVSSTELRRALVRAGEGGPDGEALRTVRELLPPAVWEYARRNGIYRRR